MPSLAETQKIFWHLITAPDGVTPGLATLPEREHHLPRGVEDLVRGDDRLPAIERLDIYAGMYFFRILAVLKEDYPSVAAVVGDGRFHNLIVDYLVEHPSKHPSARHLGRHVADFLARHELRERWQWLPDLARFEWAMVDAFDAPDREPISSDRLQAFSAEEWASVRFVLTPSLQALRLPAPVHLVWAKTSSREPAPEITLEPTIVRVWRRGHRVRHRAISRAEGAALDAVLASEDFAGVCEAVAAVESDDEAPSIAARLLQSWFADGLIVGLSPHSATI